MGAVFLENYHLIFLAIIAILILYLVLSFFGQGEQ